MNLIANIAALFIVVLVLFVIGYIATEVFPTEEEKQTRLLKEIREELRKKG